MEITPWFIYWCDVLESLSKISTIFVLVSGFVTMSLAIAFIITSSDSEFRDAAPSIKSFLKKSAFVFATAVLTSVFVPSGKVLAAMFIIPPVANSEFIQSVPADVAKLITGYLKDLTEKQIKE